MTNTKMDPELKRLILHHDYNWAWWFAWSLAGCSSGPPFDGIRQRIVHRMSSGMGATKHGAPLANKKQNMPGENAISRAL